jgi:hypothetical protein
MRVDRLKDTSMVGDENFCKQLVGFYVFLMIALQQIRNMDVIHQLPCIVAFRISSPFNQILEGMTAPKASVIVYCFNFVYFFTFN